MWIQGIRIFPNIKQEQINVQLLTHIYSNLQHTFLHGRDIAILPRHQRVRRESAASSSSAIGLPFPAADSRNMILHFSSFDSTYRYEYTLFSFFHFEW